MPCDLQRRIILDTHLYLGMIQCHYECTRHDVNWHDGRQDMGAWEAEHSASAA